MRQLVAKKQPSDEQWPPDFARAILSNLGAAESPLALFHHVELEPQGLDDFGKLVLLVSDRRMIVFGTEGSILWEANASTIFERKAGVLRSDGRLTGGQWHFVTSEHAEILVLGETFGSFEECFKPITDALQRGRA